MPRTPPRKGGNTYLWPDASPTSTPGQEQELELGEVRGQQLAVVGRNRWAALASALAVEEGTAFLASPDHRALICMCKNIKSLRCSLDV